MVGGIVVGDRGAGAGAPLPPRGWGGIACAQINLHKCFTANMTCNNWLGVNPGQPRIALFTEPYNLDYEVKGFDSNLFNIYTVGKSNRSGIATTKNIQAYLLSHLCNRDQTVITVQLERQTIVLASIYMPGDSLLPPPSDLMKELIKHCETKKLDLIICSDTNCHHIAWGSTDCNARGESLLDFILSKNLFFCNEGVKPTFETKTQRQVLDVTFVSEKLFNKIENWRVCDEFNFSDHKTIEFTINFKAVTVDTSYRNVKKTDWIKYREEVKNKRMELLDNIGNDDLDSIAIKLEEVIVSSYNNSCRLTQGKKFKKPVWWTYELTISQRKVRKLKRRIDRLRTEERFEEFRQARNEHNQAVRTTKGKKWERMCSEVEKLDTVSRVQRVFKMGKKQEIGSMRKEDGEYTSNPEDTLKVLLDRHFPDKEDDDIDEARVYQGNLNNNEINEIVNLEAVRAAFKGFKPYKAPGIDGIYPILIQKALDIIENDIVYIYRMCLKEGKSPARWLETKSVFIPKPGKADYCDAGNLRPICLSPFFSKGFERLIYWHISDKHLKDDSCKNLYSYKESISTDDAIHSLVTKIEKTLEKSEVAIVLFMDMSAAFSTANVSGLMKNLEKTGVNNNILKWTSDMLSNRTISASLNGVIVKKKSSRGCPQGGLLSGPILWNGDMRDLVSRFPKVHSTDREIFADDILNIGKGICEFTVARIIQQDIQILEKWALDHNLKFNTGKTKLMLFTNRRNFTKPPIYLYGERLEYVREMRYLGVTLDDKLSWLPHIKKTAQKATYTLMQCRKMVGKSWGLKPKVNRWLYITLVRPVLAYGCISWIKSTLTKSHMIYFEKVQRKACLSILNCMSSTPTSGMEVMLDIQPIEIFIQAQALNTYRRLIANGNWTPREGELLGDKIHSNIVKRMAIHLPLFFQPRDKLTNTEYIKTSFSTVIKSRIEANRTEIPLKPNTTNTIFCYTDGSKNKISSGSGYVINGTDENGNEGFRAHGLSNLGKTTTVYQAEIQAIIEATTKLIENGIINKNVHFYIDNQAAIQSLGGYLIRSNLTASCKRLLNILAMSNNVTLNWIPGHSNQPGNERADMLAKLGTERNIVKPIPISEATVKEEIKKWMIAIHQEDWTNPYKQDYCRQTKMLLPEVNSKLWNQLKKYPRSKMNTITQIYTGHSRLKKHLFRMKLAEDPICEQCLEEEESVEHFLCECPAFARPRFLYLGGLMIKRNELSSLSLKRILSFIKESKRFEED
jgi:ribonuclease HI